MHKNILIIRRYKGFGGIEHQILTFSEEFIKEKWNIFLLTDKDSPFAEELRKKGITVIIRTFGNIFNTAKEINMICKKHEIDIIQAHMLNEDFSCRIAKLMQPKLKHFFRVHTYIDCSHIPGWKKNIYHIASKLSDFLVDGYISINECNAKELIKRSRISKKKIFVIHDAVRTDLFNKEEAPFIKNNEIAMISNFENYKGHDVLLEGLRELKSEGNLFHVHLIGGVPGLGTSSEDHTRLNIIKETIKKFGLESLISFDGYRNDIYDAIKNCEMVVLPSDSEGTPNCLLEGMIAKKIVVASDVGGIPEFVEDGVTGFLHEPQNGHAFANAVMRAHSTDNEKITAIRNRAYETVIDNFTVGNLVPKIIDIYMKN